MGIFSTYRLLQQTTYTLIGIELALSSNQYIDCANVGVCIQQFCNQHCAQKAGTASDENVLMRKELRHCTDILKILLILICERQLFSAAAMISDDSHRVIEICRRRQCDCLQNGGM